MTKEVELQDIVFELVLPIVILQVSVPVDVAVIATVGVALVFAVKKPPSARYSVEANITVIATSKIVAIIGDTASSRFCITGFNPFNFMYHFIRIHVIYILALTVLC